MKQRVSRIQIERCNISREINRKAKSEERKWLSGLKMKADQDADWELTRVDIGGLWYRAKGGKNAF
jgi:hypothetical protein